MNDYLTKNIEAIQKKNIRLADWIMVGPDEDWFSEYHHEDGFVNLMLLEGKECRSVYSMSNPLETLRNSIADRKWLNGRYTIQLGIGLGHTVNHILQAMEPNHRLVVVETSAHLYRLALDYYDFSEVIGDGRLTLTYPDEQGICQSLDSLSVLVIRHEAFIKYYGYFAAKFETYESITEWIRNYIYRRQTIIFTNKDFGLRMSLNQVGSLPRRIVSPGVASVGRKFENVPIIVVNPGPSLIRNVTRLRQAKGKAVILATAQCLALLLAQDIEPDAILVIDQHPAYMKSVLNDWLACDHIPLITYGKSSEFATSNWQGPVITSCQTQSLPNHSRWMHYLRNKMGKVYMDVAVAHYGLRVAEFWGGNPIALVGQDLSFIGKSIYHDQYNFKLEAADNQKALSIIAGQANESESSQELHQADHSIQGYYGFSVTTNNEWKDQREVLQKVIAETRAQVINSTEGGAMIEGAEPMPLDRYISIFCRDKINLSCLAQVKSIAERKADIKAVFPGLKQDLNRLEKVTKQVVKGLDYIDRASHIVSSDDCKPDTKGKLDDYIKKHGQAKHVIGKHIKALSVLAGANLDAAMRSVDATDEIMVENGDKDTAELTGSRIYLENIGRSTEKLTQSYNRSISTIRRYSESLSGLATRPEDPDVLAEAAEASIETGLVVEAADLYDQAMDIVPDRLDLIESAAALALKRDRFKQAEDLALRLEGLPKGKEAAKSIRLDVETALAGIIAGLEDELEQGLYVRPINQTRKYLKARPGDAQVKSILDRAIALRDEKTTKAETEHQEFLASLEKEKRKQSYDRLIADSREIGQKGDFAASLKMLEEAQALIPELQEASWGIATALTQLGRLDEALEAYEGLMARFPGNLRLSFELGMVMVRLGKLGEGAELITKAMATTDEFDGYLVHLAAHHRQLNRHDLALENYDRYLKRFPTDPQAWTMRGDCLAEMGQLDQAIGAYDTALSHQSGFVDAVNHKKTVQRVLAGEGG